MTNIPIPQSRADILGEIHAGPWASKATSNVGRASASDHSQSYLRATVVDGQVVAAQSGGVSRTSNAIITEDENRTANTPYLSARDKAGNHLSPSDLTDSSILSFPQGEVTVAQARALGWLAPANHLAQARKDNASQEALDTPYTQNETPKPETHPDLDAHVLADPAIEQSVSELVTNVVGLDQLEAIRGIVENGEIDEQTLSRAASQLQIEPGQLQERMAPIMEAFKSQALAVMSEGGLDGNEVVTWAQTHARDQLNIAMNRQATQRSTSGYAKLRQGYLESLGEHNPQVALSADLGPGNTSYKDDKGRVIVRMADGSTMLWRSAIQAFARKS